MFVKTIAIIIRPFLWLLNMLIPLGDLIARIWVAQIFLLDGWAKLQNWDGTVRLIERLLCGFSNFHRGINHRC